MDEQYNNAIIECANEKLVSSGKSLSDLELLRGIIHLLKKRFGKNDPRHSSKTRFKKEYFRVIIETSDWKKKIVQLPDKKYTSAEKYNKDIANHKIDNAWNWENQNKEQSIKKTVEILKNIDDYKFELLVKDVLQKFYPEYYFCVTKKTGDLGMDIIGENHDGHNNEKTKLIIAQVKRYSKSVDRTEADRFVGAIDCFSDTKYKNVSKLMPIFVTSGKYTQGFKDKLKEASKAGISYIYWDGVELATKLIDYGMGVKYSIDLDFWKDVDSSMLPVSDSKMEVAV
jgi:restriction endonuclease Mrr